MTNGTIGLAGRRRDKRLPTFALEWVLMPWRDGTEGWMGWIVPDAYLQIGCVHFDVGGLCIQRCGACSRFA